MDFETRSNEFSYRKQSHTHKVRSDLTEGDFLIEAKLGLAQNIMESNSTQLSNRFFFKESENFFGKPGDFDISETRKRVLGFNLFKPRKQKEMYWLMRGDPQRLEIDAAIKLEPFISLFDGQGLEELESESKEDGNVANETHSNSPSRRPEV